MITYGIEILPIIRDIHAAYPQVTQTWYAKNADTGGIFDDLYEHMRDIIVRGPPWVYFPETTNIILVVYPWNVQREEAHFRGFGVRVVTISCYIGSFIGEHELEKEWLSEKEVEWTE